MVYFLCVIIFILDQLTKWLVLDGFRVGDVLPVTPFFNIVLAMNKGISFSLFTFDAKSMTYLLTFIILLISGFFIRWMIISKQQFLKFSLAFVVAGAVGNLVDRFRFGAVVDFLDFHAFGYHWPAFNVADASIFIGAAMILGFSVFGKNKEHIK